MWLETPCIEAADCEFRPETQLAETAAKLAPRNPPSPDGQNTPDGCGGQCQRQPPPRAGLGLGVFVFFIERNVPFTWTGGLRRAEEKSYVWGSLLVLLRSAARFFGAGESKTTANHTTPSWADTILIMWHQTWPRDVGRIDMRTDRGVIERPET